MTVPPRTRVEQLEAAPTLRPASDERFSGYGVMGLPFTSGHALAMMRFPASSIGPGYTSVWHRDPAGAWVFYATVPATLACPRYFGSMVSDAVEAEIRITWEAPSQFRVMIPEASLDWAVHVGSTAATRLISAVARVLPSAAWRNSALLEAMSVVAGPLLGAGRIGLHGTVPNGQRFNANPRTVWVITDSRATFAGEDLGRPGPVLPQAHLGGFWIPQRGIVAMGQTYFEPFDPTRHSSRTSGAKT